MEPVETDPGKAPGWAPVQVCTLPTAEQPLRMVEFDELFTSGLRNVERRGALSARLTLAGDAEVQEQVQRLTAAEASCCSFFTFAVMPLDHSRLALDIEVPPAYADVLSGLVARAEAVHGAAER